MKMLLLLVLPLLNTPINAQDRWTVRHNGKEVLATVAEDTAANQVVLKHGDLKKCGRLRIAYRETPTRAGWQRTIAIYDDAGNERTQARGRHLKLRNRTIRHWAKHTRRLFIYTTSLPANPAVAATVRVRRVHLCTLLLQE